MPVAAPGIAVLLSVAVVGQAGGPAQASPSVPDLVAALATSDPAGRAEAACALRELGDRAAPAIAALAALLADPSPVESRVCGERGWRGAGQHTTSPGELAAAALVSIGSRAYQALEDAAQAPAWVARRNAVWGLGALDDRRALSTLVAALRDREPPVREQAAWALGALDARDAVEPLLMALGDANAGVRQRAAWALGAIDDRRAAPGLIAALRDSDPAVREQAAWALGAIDAREAVRPLVSVLEDAVPGVRRQAAWALGAIGDRTAVPGLVAALQDRDAGVRRHAAWALGAIGR